MAIAFLAPFGRQPSLPASRYRVIAPAVGRLHNCVILDDHEVKCWGDNLPTVDLDTGRTAKAIATGLYTSCAILDDDTLKCWGNGDGASRDRRRSGRSVHP